MAHAEFDQDYVIAEARRDLLAVQRELAVAAEAEALGITLTK